MHVFKSLAISLDIFDRKRSFANVAALQIQETVLQVRAKAWLGSLPFPFSSNSWEGRLRWQRNG